jgi:fluoroacetyl-CoA thioesterase
MVGECVRSPEARSPGAGGARYKNGMARDIEPLPQGSYSMVVGEGDLASALTPDRPGAFPAVYATSRMVALMELAAARCLEPLLEEGELSVGVVIDIQHLAATPPGVEVAAQARYAGRAGKLYRFEVVASDPAGEIGRGRHERAIIRADRLLSGAQKRRPPG